MHEELVERRRWISENRFLHALNYCMVLPGPEAQQLATYIGLADAQRLGAASSPAVCSCCRRCSSSSPCPGSTWPSALYPAVAGLFYGIKRGGHGHRHLGSDSHRLAGL